MLVPLAAAFVGRGYIRRKSDQIKDNATVLHGNPNDPADTGVIGQILSLQQRAENTERRADTAEARAEEAAVRATAAEQATRDCQERESELLIRLGRIEAQNEAYVEVLARRYPGLIEPEEPEGSSHAGGASR